MRMRAPSTILFLAIALAAPLSGQSIAELNTAAWKQLRSGNADRAARLFAQALATQPDDPVLLLGAGATAHVQGRSDEAVARIQRALRANPAFVEASLLLGEIAYSLGRIDLAIETYEAALQHSPAHAGLASRLHAWREDAAAHDRFEEVRYDRFKVLFEGRAEQSLAVQATQLLDASFRQIGETLGAFPTDPVVVILYTEQQFRDITRAPEWSGGLYDGRIRVPAAGAVHTPADFERVLAHELTHAMITAIAPVGVPAWLHEGLAQHFEGRDPAAARRRLRATGRSIPLAGLEQSFTRLSAGDAVIAYDQSLLAVQPMFDRAGFGWTRLLRALAASRHVEPTLDSFGLSYADLDLAIAR